MAAPVLHKQYYYKVYDGATYLGMLQDVSSAFGYTHTINKVGSQIEITCARTMDVTSQFPPYIITEDNKYLTTEDGVKLTTEAQPQIVSENEDDIAIKNGHKIKVYEFSEFNVNGKLMFNGRIEKIQAGYAGSEDGEDSIKITVFSDGQDMANIILPGSNADVLDQSQATDDGDPGGDTGSWYTSTNYGDGQRFGQSFVVGGAVTNIAAIKVKLAQDVGVNPATITLRLWNSAAEANAGVAPLGTVVKSITPRATVAEETFRFSSPITVTPGQGLFFAIDPDPSSTFSSNRWMAFSEKSGNPYTNGIAYRRSGSDPNYKTPFDADWWFKTYNSVFTTDRTFTATEITAILDSIWTDYIASSGVIAKGAFDNTNTTITYTFKEATILEALTTCLSLAPAGWYFYVDLGTNTLYFKQHSSTPDITLVKGKHINSLDIVMSTENISNYVFFSGGDTGGGQNLFKTYSDSESIQKYGIRLARISDNRVTATSAADAIGTAFVDENKDQQHQTSVTITDGVIDTTTIKPGMTVGFAGFGNFIDELVLPIVEETYTADKVTCMLGSVPPRTNQAIIDTLTAIGKIQNIDNPNSPS